MHVNQSEPETNTCDVLYTERERHIRKERENMKVSFNVE